MKLKLNLFFLFLLVLSKSYSQDEIFMRKTGEALDYNVTISAVKNDSIYYRAFWKDQKMALSEVKKYKIGGVVHSAHPVTPAQMERLALLEKKTDSIQYLKYPKGGYMNLAEVLRKDPSVSYNFKIEKRTRSEIAGGGNDYKIRSVSDTTKAELVKKGMYAVSDADTLYINCYKLDLQKWYAKVILPGKYFVFRSVISGPEIAAAGVVFGVAGVSSASMRRFLYVLDTSSGKVSILNAKFILDKFAGDADVLNLFDNEANQEREEILIKYVRFLNY
jgi:hypothetical protein